VIPLTPWLVNTYLVRGERPVLVDTGCPSDEVAIHAALAAQDVTLADLALIVITHGHGDHFGSAAALKTGSSAAVAARAAWVATGHQRVRAGNASQTAGSRHLWLELWLEFSGVDNESSAS
jgi:glyoxylase-like metal-dependent hydrolase (beta-lactamase superfamily II)